MSRKTLEQIGKSGIEKLMEQAQLSVIEVAKACRVTRAGVYKWINVGALPKDALRVLTVLAAFPKSKIIKINPKEEFDIHGFNTENVFKVLLAHGKPDKPIFVLVEEEVLNQESQYAYSSIGITSIVAWDNTKEKVMRLDLRTLQEDESIIPSGFHSNEEIKSVVLKKCTLDDLTRELESRGWAISLSKQAKNPLKARK